MNLPMSFHLQVWPPKQAVSEGAATVMITNHPEARPQSALSEADMVYEMLW